MEAVKEKAEENANARLVELLVPGKQKETNYKIKSKIFEVFYAKKRCI